MHPLLSFLNNLCTRPPKVYVLAPFVNVGQETIDYYYDYSQSIKEYEITFAGLEIEWKWQPVSLVDYEIIIEQLAVEKQTGKYFPIVFNLCDGDEINGSPGISVIKSLEKYELLYTGADEYFYNITTSKIPMKQAFDKASVSNAPWEIIYSKDQELTGIFDRLGSPIIVKPAVSGGSMGVGIKNVVKNTNELEALVHQMYEGYRGWNLTTDGLIAEYFITGAEYTTLITGSFSLPDEIKIYTPVERVFHSSLPDEHKFLSFDRLWEVYEEEAPMPNQENFYEYRLPDASLIDEINQLSLDAFLATNGKGYTRADIRRDNNTGKLYVLEVNAQCGIIEDEDYTSIGAILKVNNKSFETLVVEIIKDAYLRFIEKIEEKRFEK